MARKSTKKTEEIKENINKTEEVDIQMVDVTEPEVSDIVNGLSSAQVQKRKEAGQVNNYVAKKGKSIARIFVDNIFTFFNMLYLAITIMLCLAHSWTDMFYLLIVIPNLAIGIFQEIKAKLTIDKLSLITAPQAMVIRDGVENYVATNEVVIDDIVILKAGDQIYSDAVVVDGIIEANESLLTGESDAITKKEGDPLYSGSFVSSGTCKAKIDHVGKDNYIEKLASEAKKHGAPKSELLKTLKIIIRVVGFIIIPLGAFTMWIEMGKSAEPTWYAKFVEAIPKTSAVVLGMIPSGLFLLTSIALFVGVLNLAKRKTLVQEIYCIETLARVDVLCLDKTGTITDGTMHVVDCIEVKNPTDFTIREIIGSMMSAFEDTNATSDALIRYFDTNKVLTPTNIIPFSSKRKFSAVTFKDPESNSSVGTFYLGAPEFVLTDQYEKVKSKVERFASQGCRVIVLGHTNSGLKEGQSPKNVKAVALIVIQDHIRDEAYKTIDYFKQNDVEVKVISGDNPITVSEIARRAGVANASRYISLEGMTDEEVADIAFEYTVFGRVTPVQKKVLVQAFKAQKKTVAMTGDGVNDILALKEADCSIAMASGSDATKYVSQLVLLDSNFASMPQVVAEGRRVINNIQRTSSLFLLKTMFVILLTLMYLFLGKFVAPNFTYPFWKPSMLMLIEIFAVGVPATVLAIQPNHEKVKGRFFKNVMKTVIPAALTIIVIHALLYTLVSLHVFELEERTFDTIAVIITNIICLFVLFEQCRPWTWWKIVMYVGFSALTFVAFVISMIGSAAEVTGFKEFIFQYVQAVNLSGNNHAYFLLLICFAFASYYILGLFKKLFATKPKKIRNPYRKQI